MDCLNKINLIRKVNEELYNSIGVEDDNLSEFLIYLCEKSTSLENFCKDVFENGGVIEQAVLKYIYNMIKKDNKKNDDENNKENISLESANDNDNNKSNNLEYKKIEMKNEKMKKYHCLTLKNEHINLDSDENGNKESKENIESTSKQVNDDKNVSTLDASDSSYQKKKRKKKYTPSVSSKNTESSFERKQIKKDNKYENGKKRKYDERYYDKHRSRHDHHDNDKHRSRHDHRHNDKHGSRHDHRHNDKHHTRYDHHDVSSSSESNHHSSKKEKEKKHRDKKKYEENKSYDDYMALKLNNIFNGTVNKITDFGLFVSFKTNEGYKEGLVHATDILPNRKRVVNMNEKFKRNMKVKVKVKGIFNEKISLNMSEVDQKTGKNLVSDDINKEEDNYISLFDDINEDLNELKKKNSHIFKEDPKETIKYESVIKMQSDYSKWEIQQLIKSGVVFDENIKKEYKNLKIDEKIEDEEDIIEIEVNEKEPAFLKGQTTKAGAKLSPIQIIVNAEGSLAKAITTTTALAKERKEQKQNEQNAIYDSIPKDISRPWEDPKPNLGERTIAEALRNIGKNYDIPEWKKNYNNNNISVGVKNTLPINEQRSKLPIYNLKNDLMKAIEKNNVLIVIGETGSGKTTQIPQYLHEASYTEKGIVGCTQPRRVAAMSIAKRVSEEFGCILGQEVGYSIRFDDCTSNDTIIKYLTDGMLLRETLSDTLLTKYSFIILDEAHERTISTDILFCLLKDVVRKRSDFKLIVTSATLDAEKFSTYFFNSPIFTIPGKIFPVEILHSKEPESDYVEASLITVLNIHLNEHPGDILVFLTGQDEINTACEILHERMKKLESMSPPPLIILPIYSSLPSEMQSVIFEPAPPGCRKCILATNIAEASLTIDGIFFVIDPGFCKIKKYDSKRDMDSLIVAPISKANAKQRAGRAGRTGPGKCYRLYTEEAYKNEMSEMSVPEIQRINLGSIVLLLKALGINDFLHFDFMDSPSVETLIHSLENLYYLGALDDNGYLTKLGKKMANFPMEPNLSKILLTSLNFNCTDDVVTIVSMLSVQNIFYRPQNKALLADKKKNKFIMPQGDLITYLNIYNKWKENSFSNYWCHENFIQSRALKRAQDVRKQMLSIFEKYNYQVKKSTHKNDSTKYVNICKSICSGYFNHVCKRDTQQGYTTLLTNQQVFIHPSSTLFNKNPLFVVYHELVLTNKEYIRDCTIIQPQWLIQLAPNLFIPADEKKISKIKLREKIEPLHNYYEEPNAWRLSRRKG
ncbi:pre-mRNA-splicing factor ATP-dependent RNA helicase PRP22, putative [Plasmodium sp. gorilla clade G2]|uniref:pre-mRNA-splicing factor ATP-dependent RNA helicase PRP22, putative n=1 Tax=Plasmodium sp. gorilla clade G2 TaxID=880535 RepID=UPI000D20C3D9|nr:pre-mRNA-splicing factor ATP-dependent RNA helicase PRP22, putative [Plasmodium sp. gorilla clade G2]SOV15130.1 pre-mRNA-splicing factor ATP-dependent RNA helicase PRP22, putative [Plasmodium sp. gorilla clade G2]